MFTYLRQSDNLIPVATLTPTTEDTDFPIENAQAEPVAKVYRSADATAEKILIEFAAPVDVDLFAIVNHSITSAGTITLRGGSSSDPNGSQFQTTITWRNRTAWKVLSAVETWRYWSLTVDDPTNPELVFEIGLLLMGEATELTRDFNFGTEKRRETVNQVLESEYGVITAGQNLFQRTRIVASWKTTDATERAALDNFLLTLEKERGGLLFIPYSDETEAFYGRFVTDYSIIRTGPDIAEISGLEFLEDSPGRSVFSL